ncbi:rhamnogalacturonan acetylesterase [Segetibacter sp. 3557_3]|nr:rhamnogalacturonan acetylesterase [Segetibacter sp. 3557_3]
MFFVLAGFAYPDGKKIRVYLIGDSTMCLYDNTRFPQAGWGMPFANYFDSTVIVRNHARGGRSSKSFMTENLWKPIVENLGEGDYVFIQFGHNDAANSAAHPARFASPEDYKKNLIVYVNDTRRKKATPVLVTPVTRRKFGDNGKPQAVHQPYSKMVAEVAAEYKVPLVDLDTRSRELLQKLGPGFSKYLYLNFEAGETPQYPAGMHDDTHFSDFGARKMAEIVLAEIRLLKLDLAERIIRREVAAR